MMKTGNQGEKTGTLQKHYITVKKEGMSMTLRELYSSIGEDYEQALRLLRVEKLVDKHIRKFTQNGVIEALLAAKGQLSCKISQHCAQSAPCRNCQAVLHAIASYE